MDPWAQHLVAPVVVGVVMLLGQWWIQPKIAEAEAKKRERQTMKRDAFVQAMALVDQHLNAQRELHKFFEGHVASGTPVSSATVNQMISAVYLLADNPSIPLVVCELFGDKLGGDVLVKRGELVNAMRLELYATMELQKPEEIPFYLNRQAG